MQTEKETSNSKSSASKATAGAAANAPKGFDQMATGLKSAITEFQETQSTDALAGILAAFKPVGEMALRMWSKSFGFARKHPVQTTVAVVAIGVILAAILKPAAKAAIASNRNY